MQYPPPRTQAVPPTQDPGSTTHPGPRQYHPPRTQAVPPTQDPGSTPHPGPRQYPSPRTQAVPPTQDPGSTTHPCCTQPHTRHPPGARPDHPGPACRCPGRACRRGILQLPLPARLKASCASCYRYPRRGGRTKKTEGEGQQQQQQLDSIWCPRLPSCYWPC